MVVVFDVSAPVGISNLMRAVRADSGYATTQSRNLSLYGARRLAPGHFNSRE